MIGILAGILLLVIALPHETLPGDGETEYSGPQETEMEEREEEILENKLQNILEQVQGVGRVRVMITMKSSGEKTVEKDRSVSEDNGGGADGSGQSERTEEATVYARDSQGNEYPVVIRETMPEVQGVLVVAQGGDNIAVAESISDAVMVLFGVEAHKIKVMKLS